MSWFLKILLDWFLEKIIGLFSSLYKKYKKDEEIKENAKESVQPLKDAKTGEEIKNATKSALDGF